MTYYEFHTSWLSFIYSFEFLKLNISQILFGRAKEDDLEGNHIFVHLCMKEAADLNWPLGLSPLPN
jgi:hypothetical protein